MEWLWDGILILIVLIGAMLMLVDKHKVRACTMLTLGLLAYGLVSTLKSIVLMMG